VTTPSETGAASAERECFRAAGVVVLGGAAAAVLLWASTFPGWPVVAGVVLSILVVAGLLVVLGEEPVPAARRLRPVGLVVALVLAIGGAISVENSSHAALRIRFEASRSDFETVVAAAGAPTSRDGRGDFPGTCPSRIGSYALGTCEAIDRGYLLLQQRAALGDDAGFAYLPDGLPSEDPTASGGLQRDQFSHLSGPWYGWSCGC